MFQKRNWTFDTSGGKIMNDGRLNEIIKDTKKSYGPPNVEARLYFLEEFRRNYIHSGTFLSYPADLHFPMTLENGK